jgi:hypothetical protein
MKDRADLKAMKKIEWLEKYMEFSSKQNIPSDAPDVVKSKEILMKLKNTEKITELKANDEDEILQSDQLNITEKSTEVPDPEEQKTAVVDTQTPNLSTDSNSTPLKPSLMTKMNTTSNSNLEEDDCTDTVEDVKSLRRQLAEAQREIETLRLERALQHAKNEIKKLKTEIGYGQEDEFDDKNIDNIFRENISPSSLVSPFKPALARKPVTPNDFSNVQPASDATATATATPPNEIITKMSRKVARASARATKMGLKGMGVSRWSKIAKDVSTLGSEALVGEDDREAYREEKKRKKKKQQFLDEIESNIPLIENNKKELHPLIKKQIESFEFLNFLDSLDGLDGNSSAANQKKPILTPQRN